MTSNKSLQVYLLFLLGDNLPLGSHIPACVASRSTNSFVLICLFDSLEDSITLWSREQVCLLLSKIKIASPFKVKVAKLLGTQEKTCSFLELRALDLRCKPTVHVIPQGPIFAPP